MNDLSSHPQMTEVEALVMRLRAEKARRIDRDDAANMLERFDRMTAALAKQLRTSMEINAKLNNEMRELKKVAGELNGDRA